MFATLHEKISFKKTKFYFVKLENEQESLFNQFINNFIESHEDDIFQIQNLIKKIGNETGAKENYFRFEKEAKAIPRTNYIDTSLRLYCLKLNESIVVVFSGCLKTRSKVQDCFNCSKHFNLANKLSKSITNLIQQKEIKYNKDYSDIIFDENLELEL